MLILYIIFLTTKVFRGCEWHARGSGYRRYKRSEPTESYSVHFAFFLQTGGATSVAVVVECCSCCLGDVPDSKEYLSFGRTVGNILCQDCGQMWVKLHGHDLSKPLAFPQWPMYCIPFIQFSSWKLKWKVQNCMKAEDGLLLMGCLPFFPEL